tara:strand:- start:1055 stop:1702 length:648 start_codon:yes stop_codon:yes gene_type:complete
MSSVLVKPALSDSALLRFRVKHALGFFHIPRSGGVSVSNAIKNSTAGRDTERTGIYTIKDYNNQFGTLPDWSFAMIRNPYERFLSVWVYNDRENDNIHSKKARWKTYIANAKTWLASQPCGEAKAIDVTTAHHALPASCFVTIDDSVSVNTLIKMENIDKVPQIIWKNTGIRICEIAHLNKTNSIDFVKEFLDEECKKHIREIYAKDFELYEGAE